MIEIEGRKICENCFAETTETVCSACGYDPENGVNDPTLLAPGTVLLERYIIGSVIGKGGFGITYLALDTASEKKVAIKEYFPYTMARRAVGNTTVTVSSEENTKAFELGAEKFYEEAKLVSRFNGNPNIVEVYEYFYENDTVYLAMEHLHGQTLKEYIRDNGTLTAPQALHVAKSVANALAVAHKASVLHRDISPDNTILCSNGKVKLIDFGAARQVVAEHSQSFSVILKPGFAPLEQYHKKGKQGPWTDIYALGATLYYALTGDIPEDPMARFDDDDTFKENQFEIDPDLWSVLLKATSLKNEDRYKDAEEMLNDLNKIRLESEPIIPAEHIGESSSKLHGTAPSDTDSYNYKQHISFSPDSKKKGLFGRHSRALIASAAGLVIIIAAVIIAAVVSKPPSTENGGNSLSDLSTNQSNESTPAEVDNSTGSDTEIPPSNTEERVYLSDSDKTMVLYSTLDDNLKELYELIYNCVANSDKSLELTPQTYDKDTVDAVYQKVLFDNPQFYYAENYSIDSGEAGEYVSSINPVYTETDKEAMKTEVSEVVRICRKDTDINTLCAIHDYIIANTKVVERDSDTLGSSAYGVVINGYADDIGFAKAFCYYVQETGLPCYVVEGEFMGEPRAWCRFKLENDIWYNSDVYGDKFAGSVVTKMDITDDSSYFQTYFLTNDEYMTAYGYTLNPEYEYLLEGEYAAASPKGNFYFQRNYQYYFYSGPDATYDLIIKTLASKYSESSDNMIALYVAPFVIDRLYDKMNDQFLAELKETYGIEVSGFTMMYTPNTLSVTLY